MVSVDVKHHVYLLKYNLLTTNVRPESFTRHNFKQNIVIGPPLGYHVMSCGHEGNHCTATSSFTVSVLVIGSTVATADM